MRQYENANSQAPYSSTLPLSNIIFWLLFNIALSVTSRIGRLAIPFFFTSSMCTPSNNQVKWGCIHFKVTFMSFFVNKYKLFIVPFVLRDDEPNYLMNLFCFIRIKACLITLFCGLM
jgi:hypothetical protein